MCIRDRSKASSVQLEVGELAAFEVLEGRRCGGLPAARKRVLQLLPNLGNEDLLVLGDEIRGNDELSVKRCKSFLGILMLARADCFCEIGIGFLESGNLPPLRILLAVPDGEHAIRGIQRFPSVEQLAVLGIACLVDEL